MEKRRNKMLSFISFYIILKSSFVVSQLAENSYAKAEQQISDAQPGINEFNYLRCWRCDYDDKEQCVKSFDFTKHKHEACDGKCLKAFEKVEARTREEIEKAQLTPTIRKCVTQKEMSSLHVLGINTENGCHDIRTAKRRHKLYCFCENDLCNNGNKMKFQGNFFALVLFILMKLNSFLF